MKVLNTHEIQEVSGAGVFSDSGELIGAGVGSILNAVGVSGMNSTLGSEFGKSLGSVIDSGLNVISGVVNGIFGGLFRPSK